MALELRDDVAGRGSPLLQGVDLAALFVLQMAELLSYGGVSHTIVQLGRQPPLSAVHVLPQPPPLVGNSNFSEIVQ